MWLNPPTINVMNGGRFQMACIWGYRDEEFDVFGVRKADRVGRLEGGNSDSSSIVDGGPRLV